MSTITVTRPMGASREAVWDVLADFADIADWNGGVTTSYSTSEASGGIGAARHCDLAPFGALEESITGWEPMRQLVVRIDSAAKLPIKTGLVTFTIDGDDAAPSVTVDYEYEPKYGPVGRLIAPLFDRQLSKGFGGFLADLDTEARRRSASVG